MSTWRMTLAVCVLTLGAPAAHAAGACTIGILTELPVTMTDLRPVIAATFNGAEIRLIADSGAFFSMVSEPIAAQFKLRLAPATYGLRVTGVGGTAVVSMTKIRDFGLAGRKFPNVDFIVGGSEVGEGAEGVLGQNMLGIADAEYDLANGIIRLIHPHDCDNSSLAYWDAAASYSTVDVERLKQAGFHNVGTAYLNGAKIRVMFDTGAAASVLSLRAAAKAGVRPDDAGVVVAGESRGIGRRTVKTWIAPFASFKIGQEEIRNTHLRIGDINDDEADMLIGADFFLSHHVYVANSQNKVYFTYSGGSVFNLTTTSGPAAVKVDANAAVASTDDKAPPMDASALARRGAASAARHDYEHALADLTRACKLEPNEAKYFFQRSQIYEQIGQREPALADVDQALKLHVNDPEVLLHRANLQFAEGKKLAAIADLRAADQAVAREADIRFDIGHAYLREDEFTAAIEQLDRWINNHPNDSKWSDALNSRCWARALWGKELDKADKDCSAALRLRSKASPGYAAMLDSRGLVRFRQGDLAKARADYDAALTQQPKLAWALYGRGLCKLRSGDAAGGDADIAAATAVHADIAEQAKKYGIGP